ncbi:MAG: hypothetical protein GF331_11510 [Chitinivibrionales bacterium]|nr:hypothetical protein [Chitinivibrionales bacterium]
MLLQVNARNRQPQQRKRPHLRRGLTAGLCLVSGGCLVGSISCLTEAAALDRSTQYFQAEMDAATTYEEKYEIQKQWLTAMERSDSYRNAGYVLMSCSVGVLLCIIPVQIVF